MILVSACLLGLNTKYNGETNAHSLIQSYCSSGRFIPVCPEQLGGLSTPREAVEIINGTGQEVLLGRSLVKGESGEGVTSQFLKGANEVLKFPRMFKVTAAILKERSPSCGVHFIYDGSFTHRMIPGQGVTSAMLKVHNIPIYSEEELTEERLKELISEDMAG
ncbi:DUF523 domain-containing protein [Desulfosporosinus sp.]|uniref:DUF523 domain-containing protein n=1 Tax=Desulfosporosinus sp. TaxID=157907 RepID=UPI0025B918E3|nr:DUF523 domain-containing protein [Desulfosporosinus sp.]MBC2722447.1 DUF523 domain-containing protein [Desulfosporosinus sp.]MBC2726474.1 DUF523 domain-containing protein [Desulfosporosinus sp.]